MQNINVNSLEKMLNFKGSNKMLKSALQIFIPKHPNVRKCLVIFFLMLVPAIFVGVSENTISAMQEAAAALTSAILSVFGIVFTGYVFLQALINKKMLLSLINDIKNNTIQDEEENKLQETNKEFTYLMMLCIVLVALDLIVGICMNTLSANFCVFSNAIINDVIATVFIVLFFYVNAIVFWDIKSFIYNIFQLFSMHAVTKVIEIIEEENKDTH